MRSVRCLKLSIGLTALLIFSSSHAAALEVWSGLTYSFAHIVSVPDQDEITPNVTIARNATGGIYNAAAESFYVPDISPDRTLWATEFNNPGGELIAASNWASLNYTDWRTAYGGAGALAGNIVGANAVLYLVDDDAYLDIQFTHWGQGFSSGGEFAYLRAVPVPEPAAWTLAVAFLVLPGANRRRQINP